MKPDNQVVEIITPRGKNIGENIKNDLVTQGIWKHITIDNVITVRNAVERCCVSTVAYSFK